MSSSQICLCCNRNIYLISSLLFLLVSSFTTQVAEGRAITKLIEATQEKGMEEEKTVVVARSKIGSRPPKCDRRCNACGPCEAVQVPVTAQSQGHKRSRFSQVANSRGDDISNYKPMGWKCKCGNLFFNP